MLRFGILLRILLGVALALNGVGGTSAATMMAMASPGPVTPDKTSEGQGATHAGCHEHAAPAHSDPVAPPADPTGKQPAGHADCCGVGACGCACAQLPSLVTGDLLLLPPTLQHDLFFGAISDSRPSPALPHLIRPPIV